MSEYTTGRPNATDERPDHVTDPLLWRLALHVADAHAPAEDGDCAHLLCAGREWPCEPWQQAQRALILAQGGAADAPQAPTRQAGWSTSPALPSRAAERARRDSAAA
ncbi:hypothetical protein ACIBO1_26335 [Micromonospora sp. NPDC049903]|uniref:hypothetical protein n=1 Tax=Micromonospora sp. NPDC049903 TaxID=3364276 RepID=UPI0037BA857E